MVKMPYFFLASLCLHVCMTFLLKGNTDFTNNKKLQNFKITLISQAINKKENATTMQIKKNVKKDISDIDKTKKTKEIVTANNNENRTPSIIYGPYPNYPENAKANGQEGEFSVTLKVNTNGNVEQVIIETKRGDLKWFEADLLKIFKTWKFAIYEKNTDFSIPITFLLDE
jgi:TonB family protein